MCGLTVMRDWHSHTSSLVVLGEILSSYAALPSALVFFFRPLFALAEARFPGSGNRALGAIFFLRLACPMIVNPYVTGVLRSDDILSPQLQRGLVCVALFDLDRSLTPTHSSL